VLFLLESLGLKGEGLEVFFEVFWPSGFVLLSSLLPYSLFFALKEEEVSDTMSESLRIPSLNFWWL